MSLKNTEEKLYKPDSEIEKRGHSGSEFDLDEAKMAGDSFKEKKTWWENFYEEWLTNEKRWAVYVGAIALGSIGILSLGYVAIVNFKETAFSENRVTVKVEGPEVVNSVKDATYTIKYENKNRVSLSNVEIVLNHSENFYPEKNDKIEIDNDRNVRVNLGEIKAFGNGEIEVTGKFYAAENFMVYLQPTLKYKAQNFNSFFVATSQLGVKITSSPVFLGIETPKEAIDESTIEYTVSYENKGGVALNNLNLKLEYPDGLIFQEAVPKPVEGDNNWYLGNLNIGAKGSIKIKSKINGQQYDIKLIRASIYKNENNEKEIVYGKSEATTKVVMPPLAIDLKVNEKNSVNVNLGDRLTYVITYSNRGDIGLKDVIVKLKLDSPIIDYAHVNLNGGAYDSTNKDFTWKVADSKDLKKLEPGDSGQFIVVLPVKNSLDIKSADDKNYAIEAMASIDSSDIAYHSLGSSKNISNTVFVKLNSKVALTREVNFDDNDIKNSGPDPVEVGQETTYAIDLKITNVSNTVSGIKVYSTIPTWAKWKGVVFPQGEDISFNERTHEVIWNVGTLENGRGFLNNPKEVKFQIGITPEVNQNKEDLKINQDIMITGKDEFTLEDINFTTGKR